MKFTMAISVACAALISSVACGGDHSSTARGAAENGGGNANAASTANQPMTVEGCLQRGGGTFSNGFLLTMLNAPAGVGTSGNLTRTGSPVEREQMREAARTYRLDPKGDLKLSDMVGRQVRVTGTMTEGAHLPQGDGGTAAVGSNDALRKRTQEDNRREHEVNLDPNDLAQLDVTSASVISDSCGTIGTGNASPTGGAANR